MTSTTLTRLSAWFTTNLYGCYIKPCPTCVPPWSGESSTLDGGHDHRSAPFHITTMLGRRRYGQRLRRALCFHPGLGFNAISNKALQNERAFAVLLGLASHDR